MTNIERGPWQAKPQTRQIDEFQPFSPADKWESAQAPRLDWVVEGAFLRGSVAILSGDGGLGKSLLMQQLMTAACAGQSWLGMRTDQCRSLGVFCEDDPDELHRRQESINWHYGLKMAQLEGMLLESRPGRDSVLMDFPRWGADGKKTVMMDQLSYKAKEHKAKIVVLDTVADVFSGNEIDRNQPRTFIRALRKLALEIQGVVILTQHPSVEGMASGSGRSGSTGWNNSVRSRLYLTMPKRKPDDDSPTNERLLRTMKNNYSKFGGKIPIKWDRGVFVLKDDDPQYHWVD